jgi:histidinol phosphatase-like PHP family hydrolase
MYGVAVNVGKGFPVQSDEGALAFFDSVKDAPVFTALQGEGREWQSLLSPETLKRFDYVFTDSMTWTNDNGKRMRLWIRNEVEVGDPQNFMEQLVDRTVKILTTEPIHIYVNPTFLPEEIAKDYDALWTEARMDKVIAAAKQKGVAIEINNRYRLPSLQFIQRAKAAGVRFTCGTNNTGPDLGRMEYCLDMIDAAKLSWRDFWTPAPRP